MINVDVSKLWDEAEPLPQYEAFLQARLPASSGQDPFQLDLHRNGRQVAHPLASRNDQLQKLTKTLVQPVNTVICGRPCSGKSTLSEHAISSLPPKHRILIVNWQFTLGRNDPAEIFVGFRRHELIHRILVAPGIAAVCRRLEHLLVDSEDKLAKLLELLTTPDTSWLADHGPALPLNTAARAELRQRMERLSKDEIDAIYFDLGIPASLSSESTNAARVIILLTHLQSQQREQELLEWLKKKASNVSLADLDPAQSNTQPQWQPYEHVRIVVDELDKLAPATQRRLVREAVCLSDAYPNLYFMLVGTQDLKQEARAHLFWLPLREWSDEELRDLLGARIKAIHTNITLADARKNWPILLNLNQELDQPALQHLCQTLSQGAIRVYAHGHVHRSLADAPVHALNLARGVVWACAMRDGGPKITQAEINELIEAYWQHVPKEDGPRLPHFQGRTDEKACLCPSNGSDSQLINVYGEPGMGKTRLLAEAASELRCRSIQQVVCHADFDTFKEFHSSHWQSKLLRALVTSADGRLTYAGNEPTAAEIVDQLSALPGPPPVLMFDTTEVVHDNPPFLDWLEAEVIVPLLTRSKVRMVFAGRTRVPWPGRRPISDVKKLIPLNTLEKALPDDPAQQLVREILRLRPLGLDDAQVDKLTDVVINLSCCHPELAKCLAYSTVIDGQTFGQRLSGRLAREVVRPFINTEWFKGLKAPWPQILWSASILPWFDSDVLRDFLQAYKPTLAPDSRDAFFIQGISDIMTTTAAVIWAEGGYRLNDAIREITRHCWQLNSRTDYDHARKCAREIWQKFIRDPELEDNRARYQQEYDTI